MSSGIGCRHGSDLALLWLWWRLAAVALAQPLAWELPYATGTALRKNKITTTTTTKTMPISEYGLGTFLEAYSS